MSTPYSYTYGLEALEVEQVPISLTFPSLSRSRYLLSIISDSFTFTEIKHSRNGYAAGTCFFSATERRRRRSKAAVFAPNHSEGKYDAHLKSLTQYFVTNSVRCCLHGTISIGLLTRTYGTSIFKLRTPIFSRPTREKGIGDKIRLDVKQDQLVR